MYLRINNEALIRSIVPDYVYKYYLNRSENTDLVNLSNIDLNEIRNREYKELQQSYYDIASVIMEKASKYTPYVTGKLLNSMYFRKYGDGMVVGYGADYATYVHEIGFYRHAEPTRYKFLEDAAIEAIVENNTDVPVTITYDPLAVYIGVPSIGSSVVDVRLSELRNKNKINKEDLYNDFVNFDPEHSDMRTIAYMNKMYQFIKYWELRGYDTDMVLNQWIDRNRHK